MERVPMWLDDLAQDARYTVRGWAKHKGFTATALTALALGIGATTAIFSVVSGVLLRPLPFAASDRLVSFSSTPAERGEAIAWTHVEAFRRYSRSMEALGGYSVGAHYFHGPDGPERVMTVQVERGLFSMLGVAPLIGHTFRADDAPTTAIASESFWRRRLGGDASIIGTSIIVGDAPVTVVGVMPDAFQFPYHSGSILAGVDAQTRTDLWLLLDPPPGQPLRGRYSVTGRLKPGVTMAAAQSELTAIRARVQAQEPPAATKGLGVRLARLSDAVVAVPIRRSLFILFGAVSIVLALACANVANLLLVRMAMRSREVAARAALGASRLRLMRQFLTESLVLAAVGGAAGLALAWLATQQIVRLAASQIPRSHEVGLDWRVFAFVLGVCVVSSIVFGLAPALTAMRADAQSILREASDQSTMGIGRRRFRDGLLVAEVAGAFVLAVGASLLLRELVRLRNTVTGMTPANVVTVHVGQRMILGSRGRELYEIADRVSRLPGVRSAGFTQMIPLQSWGWMATSTDFRRRGQPANDASLYTMELRFVTPGYFAALGIPIRRGRALTTADDSSAPPVILINEALARRAFGAEDPVGLETTRGRIVGVVADVRQVKVDRPSAPELYYPIAQNWSQVGELGMSLVVSASASPLPLVDPIRRVIREVDPNLAVFGIKTMESVVSDSLADFRLYLWLMIGFAVLALFLASTGAYGVIAYIAESRVREFAIRVALGADRTQVVQMVVGQALGRAAIGVATGLVTTIVATPLLENLPTTVRPPDVVTTVPVALLIGVVATIACLVPARRAANADPMSTLRTE